MQVTEFTPFAPGAVLRGIASGPDGDLWVTDASDDTIVRINPAGEKVGEYRVPQPGAEPIQIISGPEGLMWFTEYEHDALGQVNMSGEMKEVPMGENLARATQ